MLPGLPGPQGERRRGAAGGAATGALVGAIAGDAGKGAAVVAVTGAVAGGMRIALTAHRPYAPNIAPLWYSSRVSRSRGFVAVRIEGRTRSI
ncbi:YMGG-like glycine zipper-containing protein [Paraburkholderia sp. RL17-337-BIB-A]|uniref:YMGG-like glycine zipper-containing protein n=1 Tax=Paraburkholderia sp. RL17-337-BIB-A TaxID=3031636 RepID=UPI0038B7C459